jgi:hypothetical protein
VTESTLTDRDFELIREGLANLPRADNHKPGEKVDTSRMLIVNDHRAVLDPDRALVVGNRGMGKSYWAHALADSGAREQAATTVRALNNVNVYMGFNSSERTQEIAPTPTALTEALQQGCDAGLIWRAVLLRAARYRGIGTDVIPESFVRAVQWTAANGEQVDRVLTELDDRCAADRIKLLIVFDALDRLGKDWKTTRDLTRALLERALAVASYRSIRLKLFMRRDQFEDQKLFQFPDGSKIRNTRVDLSWSSEDLYELLFTHLKNDGVSKEAFTKLLSSAPAVSLSEKSKPSVDRIAGEFMGTGEKRGRVYTWLPLHLADARGETSPRTFLTAWREAAHHMPALAGRAVDHLGIIEGVRKASEDRVSELKEDYWWIEPALNPLRDQTVPIERNLLDEIWRSSRTVEGIRNESSKRGGLAPVQLELGNEIGLSPEQALSNALVAIGVFEQRSNGKINIPDIFRVEAGIKRKGGVKPPKKNRSDHSSSE